MGGYNCCIIFQYYFMNYYLTTYHSKRLKILSKQVNLCLYRESQRIQFYTDISCLGGVFAKHTSRDDISV
jgi:hypothetical protein